MTTSRSTGGGGRVERDAVDNEKKDENRMSQWTRPKKNNTKNWIWIIYTSFMFVHKQLAKYKKLI